MNGINKIDNLLFVYKVEVFGESVGSSVLTKDVMSPKKVRLSMIYFNLILFHASAITGRYEYARSRCDSDAVSTELMIATVRTIWIFSTSTSVTCKYQWSASEYWSHRKSDMLPIFLHWYDLHDFNRWIHYYAQYAQVPTICVWSWCRFIFF